MRNVRIGLFCLLSCSFMAALSRHDYHVSVTQMQFNEAQKTWEVSIRVFTDDLEMALAESNNGQRFVVTNEDRNSPYIAAYLSRHFELRTTQNQILKLKYLGKEQEADATWIYLEIPSAGQNLILKNAVFMEVFNDQVNMVKVVGSAGSKTYLYKKGATQQSI